MIIFISPTTTAESKVINKDSKYADECKEFFNFMAEKENAQRYYDGKKNLVVSALVDVTVETPRSWTSMIENATAGTGMDFASLTPFYNADNVGKAFQDLYMGGRTPMEVLQKIDEDRALNKKYDAGGLSVKETEAARLYGRRSYVPKKNIQ